MSLSDELNAMLQAGGLSKAELEGASHAELVRLAGAEACLRKETERRIRELEGALGDLLYALEPMLVSGHEVAADGYKEAVSQSKRILGREYT